MTEVNPLSPQVDQAIHRRIVQRATDINDKLLARFTTAAEDLKLGQCRAALGALDGIEEQVHTLRSLLHLAF